MANIPITSVPAGGSQYTVAGIGQAVTATDTLTGVDDRTEIVVYNANAGTCSVTVLDPGSTPAGNAGAPVAVSVPTVTFAVIPISPAHVSPSTGLASVTFSPTSSVRVAAYRR
jgi:hypothetical protein